MEICFRCPCGNEMVASSGKEGSTATCPACNREVAVPSPEAPAGPDDATPRQPAPPEPERKPCPFCLEPIHTQARKCPHCQEYLDPALAAAAAPQPPTSRWAVASLALGALSPIFLVFLIIPAGLAVGCGIAALRSIRRGKAKGKGMAIAGILIALFWIAVFVALVAAFSKVPPALSPLEPQF